MSEEIEETAPVQGPTSSAEDSNASDAGPSPAAQQEALTPKERRQRQRTARAARQPRDATPRTPEDRQAARVEERRQKAAARRVQRARSRQKARAQRAEAAPTAAREHQPGVQKVRQGVVVSDKADKTITVRIDVTRRHRRYEKIVRTSRTLRAHDERNDAHMGDTVIVRESRPLSRSKRWRLVQVLERAK
jgi:small subunit ribosomal protein S17